MSSRFWGFLVFCLLASVCAFAAPAVDDPNGAGPRWKIQDGAVWAFAGREGWAVRFDRQTFQKLTGKAPTAAFRLRKLQLGSGAPKRVFLLVEDTQRYVFQYDIQKGLWRLQHGLAKETIKEENVDLAAMDETPPPPPTARPTERSAASASPSAGAASVEKVRGRGTASFTAPIFKFLFDFWAYQKGGQPLTFDSLHNWLLVDILPTQDIQFSFELNPNPRFFEVVYSGYPKATFRIGRIWIPFDQITPYTPHLMFGGFPNVTQFLHPAAPGVGAFLPDVWADLGIAVKYQLVHNAGMQVSAEGYIVNGFGSGGTDPLLGANPYPNFLTPTKPDNNADKSLGGRVTAHIGQNWTLGVSFFTGRYTDQALESRGVTMLGVDSQLGFISGTEFKAGGTMMSVGLLPPSTVASFGRIGTYGEISQRFLRTWKIFVRGGSSQNDDRVTSVGDKILLGGGVGLNLGYLQLSVLYSKDVHDVPGKAMQDIAAMHAMLML